MGIIGNIVVIYEIKSFYVTLAAGNFFPNNIHRANYHFTHSKKLKKPDNTTILLLGGIVYRKRPHLQTHAKPLQRGSTYDRSRHLQYSCDMHICAQCKLCQS
jgi:hypothetical protein